MLKFVSGMIAGLVVFFFGVTVGVAGEEMLKDRDAAEHRKGYREGLDETYARNQNKRYTEEEEEE